MINYWTAPPPNHSSSFSRPLHSGGTWSCVNSVLYQIPTEIFNEYMLMGRLSDKEDLDALVEKICIEKPSVSELYGYTDIWVGVGGNWSGLPSMHFKIPSDVFEYLVEKGNTEKTIGRMVTDDDLVKLVDTTRNEIKHGPAATGEVLVRSRPTNTEVKECGHTCTTSSLKQGKYQPRLVLSTFLRHEHPLSGS